MRHPSTYLPITLWLALSSCNSGSGPATADNVGSLDDTLADITTEETATKETATEETDTHEDCEPGCLSIDQPVELCSLDDYWIRRPFNYTFDRKTRVRLLGGRFPVPLEQGTANLNPGIRFDITTTLGKNVVPDIHEAVVKIVENERIGSKAQGWRRLDVEQTWSIDGGEKNRFWLSVEHSPDRVGSTYRFQASNDMETELSQLLVLRNEEHMDIYPEGVKGGGRFLSCSLHWMEEDRVVVNLDNGLVEFGMRTMGTRLSVQGDLPGIVSHVNGTVGSIRFETGGYDETSYSSGQIGRHAIPSLLARFSMRETGECGFALWFNHLETPGHYEGAMFDCSFGELYQVHVLGVDLPEKYTGQ